MSHNGAFTLMVSEEYKSLSVGVELNSLDLYSWLVASRRSGVVVVVVVVDVVKSKSPHLISIRSVGVKYILFVAYICYSVRSSFTW